MFGWPLAKRDVWLVLESCRAGSPDHTKSKNSKPDIVAVVGVLMIQAAFDTSISDRYMVNPLKSLGFSTVADPAMLSSFPIAALAAGISPSSATARWLENGTGSEQTSYCKTANQNKQFPACVVIVFPSRQPELLVLLLQAH